MGLDTIPDRTNGQTMIQSFFNLLKSVLKGNLVPRNTSGVVTSLSGSLGTETYKWLKAYIAAGYFGCGDVKWMHTYNGTVAIPQGWMICNGDQITEAAYEAQTDKTTGDWAKYVGSSPLENLYTPNMIDKYLVGAAATTETGVGAISAIGNASHQIDLQHAHTMNSHTHAFTLPLGADEVASGVPGSNIYKGGTTSGTVATMQNQLSTTQSIQPHSIASIPLIRIIA